MEEDRELAYTTNCLKRNAGRMGTRGQHIIVPQLGGFRSYNTALAAGQSPCIHVSLSLALGLFPADCRGQRANNTKGHKRTASADPAGRHQTHLTGAHWQFQRDGILMRRAPSPFAPAHKSNRSSPACSCTAVSISSRRPKTPPHIPRDLNGIELHPRHCAPSATNNTRQHPRASSPTYRRWSPPGRTRASGSCAASCQSCSRRPSSRRPS